MTNAITRRCFANVLYIRHASSRTPDSGFMAGMLQPGSEVGMEGGDLTCRCRTARSGGETAVDRDRGTGDVAASVAGQVHDGPGDVVRDAIAAERRDTAQGAGRRTVG